MKFLVLSLLAVYSVNSLADFDSCKYSCSESCINTAKDKIKEMRKYVRACSGGDTDPTPPSRRSVELFHGDKCDRGLRAVVNQSTRCENLPNASQSVWSIRVGGQCINTTDTNLQNACELFKGRSVELYNGDKCDRELRAIVGNRTDCRKLENQNASVWSLKIDGQCINTSDTNVANACKLYKGGEVLLFNGDKCDRELRATVSTRTSCDDLPNASSTVWSVMINNVCHDISDSNVRNACKNFSSGRVKLFHGDKCDRGLRATVGASTDCQKLANGSATVWSIEIDGQCSDISDTNVANACELYKGR